MQGSIELLSQELVNQIAAGEVIERPASVVKELVENAIDAGAGSICVEVDGGGIDMIRVTDNGCGIPAAELQTAILRHATSKIKDSADLFAIRTLGFRGEALPSIIAVSRTSISSRTAAEGSGAFLIMEGGTILRQGGKGLPQGTIVEVRDLFYNTPARKKFLKTIATEQRNIVDVISRYSLADTNMAFRLIINGRTIFDIPQGMPMNERIPLIIGRNLQDRLRYFEKKRPGITIRGYLAAPEISRPTRAAIYPFVNSRAVRDTTMTAAVIEGYRGMLMTRKYPVALIFLNMDTASIDVNVHPAKAEVRFQNTSAVFGLIAGSVRESLANPPSSDGFGIHPSQSNESSALFPDFFASAPPHQPTRASVMHVTENMFNYSVQTVSVPEHNNESSAALGRRIFYTAKRIAGTLRSTYIVLEDNEAIYLLDQHAAHERINFENLRRSPASGIQGRQTLLSPVILELSKTEHRMLEDLTDYLNTLGFDIYEFGPDAAAIRAVPPSLSNGNIKAIIMKVIHDMIEGIIARNHNRDEILATMACHQSVRAGKELTMPEINRLLEDLDANGAPQTCPHGRPIYKKIDFSEIERWIGRRP